MVSFEEEIGLHRMTLGDYPPKLHDFLQAALRAGLYRGWVVHVKGPGPLRLEGGHYVRHNS